jgi:hypothetical protein
MNKSYLLIALILIFKITLSQDCPNQGKGFINFRSQAEIDNFKINFPRCKCLNVPVGIAGGNIKNLNGLSGLERIGSINSGLYIGLYFDDEGKRIIAGNPLLIDLKGMDNLRSVNYLWIGYNPVLENFYGLSKLDTIYQEFTVAQNPKLISFSGLDSLVIVSSLTIGVNKSVQNLKGLEGISVFPKRILIRDNNSLKDLTGLEQLKELNSLDILYNDSLESLKGLENLTEFKGEFLGNGELYIIENDALQNLSALKNLRSMGKAYDGMFGSWGGLTISKNKNLTSIEGIQNIDPTTISQLSIGGNSSLTECKIESVCKMLGIADSLVYITDNGISCNKEEVKNACNNSTFVSSLRKNEISAFPNPAIDFINITSSVKIISCKILDIYGTERIVEPKNFESCFKISVESLKNGIYFIALNTSNQVYIKKFVIQK